MSTAGETLEPVTSKGRRTRARLVAAARDVFEERGFNDTRMSDIAERAGVSHGTVYVYFDSKATVLRSVVDELLAEIGAYLRGAEADSAEGRIAEANLRYLQVYADHARLLQVVEQVGTADAAFAELLSSFRAQHVERIAEGIRRLQSQERVPSALDPQVAAGALSAMVEGFARHSPGFEVAAAHDTITLLWLGALGLPIEREGQAHKSDREQEHRNAVHL